MQTVKIFTYCENSWSTYISVQWNSVQFDARQCCSALCRCNFFYGPQLNLNLFANFQWYSYLFFTDTFLLKVGVSLFFLSCFFCFWGQYLKKSERKKKLSLVLFALTKFNHKIFFKTFGMLFKSYINPCANFPINYSP